MTYRVPPPPGPDDVPGAKPSFPLLGDEAPEAHIFILRKGDKAVPGKRGRGRCRFCKKRPPWKDKNCPPGVCKRCYHKHVWPDRPAARKARPTATTPGSADCEIEPA